MEICLFYQMDYRAVVKFNFIPNAYVGFVSTCALELDHRLDPLLIYLTWVLSSVEALSSSCRNPQSQMDEAARQELKAMATSSIKTDVHLPYQSSQQSINLFFFHGHNCSWTIRLGSMPSKLFCKRDREIENIITALSAYKKVKYNKDIFNFAPFYVPYHSVFFPPSIHFYDDHSSADKLLSLADRWRDSDGSTEADLGCEINAASELHGVATATAILLIWNQSLNKKQR